jgi:hypothetical protein
LRSSCSSLPERSCPIPWLRRRQLRCDIKLRDRAASGMSSVHYQFATQNTLVVPIQTQRADQPCQPCEPLEQRRGSALCWTAAPVRGELGSVQHRYSSTSKAAVVYFYTTFNAFRPAHPSLRTISDGLLPAFLHTRLLPQVCGVTSKKHQPRRTNVDKLSTAEADTSDSDGAGLSCERPHVIPPTTSHGAGLPEVLHRN